MDADIEDEASTVHDSQTEIREPRRALKRHRVTSPSLNNETSESLPLVYPLAGPSIQSDAEFTDGDGNVDAEEWHVDAGAEFQMFELSDVAVTPWVDNSPDMPLAHSEFGANNARSQSALYVSPAVAQLVNGTSPPPLLTLPHYQHPN